jgi:hypothetical protein
MTDNWSFTTCRESWYKRRDAEHRKQLIEELYTLVSGSNVFMPEDRKEIKELRELIDLLSIKLVGKVPDSFEEYT